MRTAPLMTDIEYHASIGKSSRRSAATHRAYLRWYNDPSQRRWAISCASAYDLLAAAHEKRTADLRAQAEVSDVVA